MMLTIAALRMRLRQEVRDHRFALLTSYVRSYQGLPPASELDALDEQLRRIDGPLPRGDFCPCCYFQNGSQANQMTENGVGPGKFVRVTCDQCGFEDFRSK
jgi:hypothetical protein